MITCLVALILLVVITSIVVVVLVLASAAPILLIVLALPILDYVVLRTIIECKKSKKRLKKEGES